MIRRSRFEQAMTVLKVLDRRPLNRTNVMWRSGINSSSVHLIDALKSKNLIELVDAPSQNIKLNLGFDRYVYRITPDGQRVLGKYLEVCKQTGLEVIS